MTESVQDAPTDAAAAAREVQRQSLDQIVKLSIECAGEEQRIEHKHGAALARENAEFQKAAAAAQERYEDQMETHRSSASQQEQTIREGYETKRQTAETTNESTRRQVQRAREEAESALKKKLEQACWHAESTCVAIEMQADVDDKRSKQELDEHLKEFASLDASVQTAMARYESAAAPADAPPDDALKQRAAAKPRVVMDEQRQRAKALLQELQALAQVRVVAGLIPIGMIAAVAALAGLIGWLLPAESGTEMLAAIGAALLALVIGLAVYMFFRGREQVRIRAKARAVHAQAMEALTLGRLAARAIAESAIAARARQVSEARKSSVHEANLAREEAKSLQRQAGEKHRLQAEETAQRYQEQLASIEQQKQEGLAELELRRHDEARQIEEQYAQSRTEAEARHASTLREIETDYEKEYTALETRWNDGLRAVSDLLAVGSGIDPRLVDWNSPAWEQWTAPATFSGQVRFGEMKINLAQLTEHVPRRLKLPDTFSVPALLTLPAHASLLVETDHAGRSAAIDVAQLVMARLLTQIPAGRAKFTIFDPVGLGQSFAGFMHLADHDESLVGARIWTEREHMNQRLADLTEHMETVIQKYLRNEYATIDEYNAQAGELAEPIRFLVIADFPTGLEPEALRRLASIATTGPRCGVYTIILRDTRQALPAGTRMEEIIAHSVHLQHKNGAFIWDDAVFKRFPLQVDPPPGEKVLTELMDRVGRAAKEAKRVEVPFQSIAPVADDFWSMNSKSDLRVFIGKSGATRLQALRLGVGVAQHVLVAGKTGSGKSNLLNTIVTNMAMWYGPDEVEFYLVDFKKGVEFKAYAEKELPHARAIAVESEREFGLSVLQRVDAELTRRGTMFREAGVQDLATYRDRTGLKLPRTVLLVDEFQEFFSEDDKLAQEASALLDRLVRQGRAFGVHVILGSQTIGGTSGLARSTLGQIAVRVALQCTEADSQMILGDNNSAARLLTRPGEAVYNDAGGLVEANSPFQIAFLPDGQRVEYLERVRTLSQARGVAAQAPIVFEGNTAAAIGRNPRLMALLERADYPPATSAVLAYVGEPVAIKEPSAIPFRRQGGANVLMVGQQEESANAIFASMVASLAAQHKPGDAIFYLFDGSPADSRYFGVLERVLAAIPHPSKVIAWRDVPAAINELAAALAQRQSDEDRAGAAVYVLLFGLQRYRLLRRQEDDFSFSRSDEPAAAKPDKQFAELLSEGPALGVHTVIWADTPVTLERTLDRSAMRQFDHRILFQMSASDSSNLIDSPLANRLGTHRALLYSEEQGTFEKCRPYEVPGDAWLAFLAGRLKKRG